MRVAPTLRRSGVLLLCAFVALAANACTPAHATTWTRPFKDTSAYVPKVQWMGDSIVDGVGGTDEPGERGYLYFTALAAGKALYFTGNLTNDNPGGNPAAPHYLGIDPHNEGIPGATIDHFLPSGFDLVSRMSAPGPSGQGTPDAVWIRIGTNNLDPAICCAVDGGPNVPDPPATVINKLSTLIQTVWALRDLGHPWFQIVLFEITPRLDSVDASVTATNALMPAMIAALPAAIQAHLTFIPDNTLGCLPKDPANFSGGANQHPNDTGYLLLGACDYPLVAPAILKSRGRRDFTARWHEAPRPSIRPHTRTTERTTTRNRRSEPCAA